MAFPRNIGRAEQIIQKTLNATATIIRKSHVPDTTGGFTDTYATVGTYPCSFSRYQITPLERETTFGINAIAFWQFVFPVRTQIHITDRIICNSRTFEVVSAASGSWEIAARVLAQEIT
jgi:hypothetical protein